MNGTMIAVVTRTCRQMFQEARCGTTAQLSSNDAGYRASAMIAAVFQRGAGTTGRPGTWEKTPSKPLIVCGVASPVSRGSAALIQWRRGALCSQAVSASALAKEKAITDRKST